MDLQVGFKNPDFIRSGDTGIIINIMHWMRLSILRMGLIVYILNLFGALLIVVV